MKQKNIEQEFKNIFEQYYPLIIGSIYNYVENIDNAEHICQEVFFKLYNKLDNIEDKNNIRKRLYSLLKEEIINYYESNLNRLNEDEFYDDTSLSFVDGFNDTKKIINDAINSALDDDKEKLIFELIAVHNYTYEQASKIVGMSKQKVKDTYALITQKVINHFKKDGIITI